MSPGRQPPSRKLRRSPSPSGGSGERCGATRATEGSNSVDQLEMVMNGLVEGVLAVDLDERIFHLNDSAARLLDVNGQASLGKKLDELTQLENLSTTVSRALETRCETTGEATVAMPANQRDLVLEFEASPIRNQAGVTTGAVLSIHDITDLRHLEHVRQDFVANVSHELKTPITAIRGLIETILTDDEMPGETQTRFLEKVHAQALRLSVLVTDMYSAIE